MPALANKVYFNYGGQGPLPTPSLVAIQQSWGTIQELGPFSEAVFPYASRTITELRQRLAPWLEVPPQRLAFTENVSSGCVLPLWGLPWPRALRSAAGGWRCCCEAMAPGAETRAWFLRPAPARRWGMRPWSTPKALG
jgi:hypothetical protein